MNKKFGVFLLSLVLIFLIVGASVVEVVGAKELYYVDQNGYIQPAMSNEPAGTVYYTSVEDAIDSGGVVMDYASAVATDSAKKTSTQGAIDNVLSGLGTQAKVFSNNLSNWDGLPRALFFILVFLIINAIVSFIPLFHGKKGTKMLVALIISILSVFFIPVELIKPMLNPYTALGVTLISIIPFVGWIFTFIIFLSTLGSVSNYFYQLLKYEK